MKDGDPFEGPPKHSFTQDFALRIFSVVVEPARWGRSLADLASLLAPITGTPADSLEQLLGRGPVTVESDLTPSSARQLCARLEGLGIPARIQGDEPELAKTIADNPDIDAMLAEMGVSTIEVADDSELADEVNRRLGEARGEGPGVPDLASEKRPAPAAQSGPDEPRHARTLLGGFQTLDPDVQAVIEKARNEELQEPEKEASQVQTKAPRANREEDGGWGALFPGLDPGESPPEERQEPATVASESLDEILAKDSQQFDAADAVDDIVSASAEFVSRSEPRSAEPDREPAPAQTPSIEREKGLEAAKLSRAFLDESGKAPYEPSGFDPRPEHSSGVAALMSLLAPGAGQVFNGDSEEALEYGWKAFMLVPWYESVKDAREKGEKIRTHWAPRPEPGAFAASLKYLLAWWLCVGSIVFMIQWFGTSIYDAITREDVSEITQADIARAVEDANLQMLQARVNALDAVAEYRENAPKRNFTMTREERAERLFRIGYAECKAGDYGACESTMKKVTALDRSNRNAFKLQTWASMQRRNSGRLEPMPDVGTVESLGEYETRDSPETPE